MLIISGGGDGPGFRIDNSGVHPIPPFGPEVVQYLRTVGQLVRLSDAEVKPEIAAEARQAARGFVGHLSNVEKAAGVIITDGRVADFAFADVDGGFICGNNGSHLVPFPPIPKFGAAGSAAVR